MTPENRKALSDFRLKLDSLLADFDESARRVVTAQANAGLAATKRETPYRTGHLRRNWRRD